MKLGLKVELVMHMILPRSWSEIVKTDKLININLRGMFKSFR